jgi:tetratricopeptide (TPR) repeat protein
MADRARGYGILNSEILALTELAGLEADAIEWERAHGYLATARRRSREENDRQMEAMVDDHSCRVYQKQGEMQRAFESCLASLRAREELGLETEMVSTLVSLGQILSDRGEIAESRRHYLRALEIFGRFPDAEREAVIHNDLALLYRDEGRYQEAVASFERSLEFYGDQYDVTKAARVLYNMGGTYERLGETDRALELYRRAVGWMDQAGDLTGRIELRGSLAWALREEGYREEGRRVLAELSSLTQDIDSNPLLARTIETPERGNRRVARLLDEGLVLRHGRLLGIELFGN